MRGARVLIEGFRTHGAGMKVIPKGTTEVNTKWTAVDERQRARYIDVTVARYIMCAETVTRMRSPRTGARKGIGRRFRLWGR